MAITASTRRNTAGASPAHAGEQREAGEAERPRAAGCACRAGERVDALIDPHSVARGGPAARPARLDGVVAVPRQRGRRRAARGRARRARATMRVMHLARSARCRARSAGTSTSEAHPPWRAPAVRRRRAAAAATRRGSVNAAPRVAGRRRPSSSRRRRVDLVERAGPRVERRAGSTSAASPATSGRAARSLQITGVPERHRLEHRRAEPLVLATGTRAPRPPAISPSRSASETRPGGPPGAEPRRGDRPGDVVLDGPRPPSSTRRRSGSVQRPASRSSRTAVVLVGVGDRRVDE